MEHSEIRALATVVTGVHGNIALGVAVEPQRCIADQLMAKVDVMRDMYERVQQCQDPQSFSLETDASQERDESGADAGPFQWRLRSPRSEDTTLADSIAPGFLLRTQRPMTITSRVHRTDLNKESSSCTSSSLHIVSTLLTP